MDSRTPMILTQARPGDRVAIRRIKGGGGFLHRLAGMGLLPGREVSIIRNRGPVIVQLNRERFVVGRGMADRIEVEPLAPAAGHARGRAAAQEKPA